MTKSGKDVYLQNLEYLTPLLPCCHMKMTNRSVKFETVEPFCLLFLALACEKIFIAMHSTKRACVIGPENLLLLRCVRASFSLEIVKAGAVKGLSSVLL